MFGSPRLGICSKIWSPPISPEEDTPEILFNTHCTLSEIRVVLVKRVKGGWEPFGRCVFQMLPEQHEYTAQLLHENTLLYNGKVSLHVDVGCPPCPLREPVDTLYRQWFSIRSEDKKRIDEMRETCLSWVTRVGASHPELQKVHMNFWNNNTCSVPGWFFAMDLPPSPRYIDELIEPYHLAEEIMRSQARGTSENTLALTLTVIGGSIKYRHDTHDGIHRAVIERFSSVARMDGVGDCEDIAKEMAMAFLDIKNYSGDHPGLVWLRKEASRFVAAMCVGSVTKTGESEQRGHCFLVLIPIAFLCSGDSSKPCLLCDGTYISYPGHERPENWPAPPFQYNHVVSAMFCEQVGEEVIREVMFCNPDNTYGVPFQALMECRSADVKCSATHGTLTANDLRIAASVVSGNRPIVAETYDAAEIKPAKSFIERFLHNHKSAKGLIDANETMASSQQLVGDVPGYCASREEFDEQLQRTMGKIEFAGDISKNGMKTLNSGEYYSISRTIPRPDTFGGFHNHHTGENERLFNPPSSADVQVFLAQVAISRLNDTHTLRTIEVVWTRYHVYEITFFDDYLYSNASALLVGQGFKLENVSVQSWWQAAKSILERQGVDKEVAALGLNNIFKNDEIDRQYRALFIKVGVSMPRYTIEEYRRRCLL